MKPISLVSLSPLPAQSMCRCRHLSLCRCRHHSLHLYLSLHFILFNSFKLFMLYGTFKPFRFYFYPFKPRNIITSNNHLSNNINHPLYSTYWPKHWTCGMTVCSHCMPLLLGKLSIFIESFLYLDICKIFHNTICNFVLSLSRAYGGAQYN